VRQDPIANFKALWSGEASAVKTYKNCVESLDDTRLVQTAQYCLSLHVANEQALRAHIISLGDNVEHIDVWHSICSLKDAVAGALGDGVTFLTLRQMEEGFLGEYMDKISAFENENLDLIQQHLIPNQERCYEAWVAYDQPQPDVLP
jgi:hypothetical protein